MILQRARQCLGGARAAFVDQDDQRQVAELAIAFRDVRGVDIAFAAARAEHDGILGKKLARDLDGVGDDPAGIGAHIENDLLRVQAAQLLQRGVYFIGRAPQKVFEP